MISVTASGSTIAHTVSNKRFLTLFLLFSFLYNVILSDSYYGLTGVPSGRRLNSQPRFLKTGEFLDANIIQHQFSIRPHK